MSALEKHSLTSKSWESAAQVAVNLSRWHTHGERVSVSTQTRLTVSQHADRSDKPSHCPTQLFNRTALGLTRHKLSICA